MSHDSYTCVTWLIHICDMTHSHMWHDSSTSVAWRIHLCDMTQTTVYTCAAWRIYLCDTILSRHVWMSHVIYVDESCQICEWVMSRMWLSHVTQVYESCHMGHMNSNKSCHAGVPSCTVHLCDMMHIPTWRISLKSHMSESCHTYERAMSHMWLSHVTQVYESCHMCHMNSNEPCHTGGPNCTVHLCDQTNTPMWHLSVKSHMDESCHIYEWVMSRISMSGITYMNESCHRYQRDIHMCAVTYSYVMDYCIFLCDMTRSFTGNDRFIQPSLSW